MRIYNVLHNLEPDVDWYHDFDTAVREYQKYKNEIERYLIDLNTFITYHCERDYKRHDF